MSTRISRWFNGGRKEYDVAWDRWKIASEKYPQDVFNRSPQRTAAADNLQAAEQNLRWWRRLR